MDLEGHSQQGCQLLSLPKELLQMVLDVPQRSACKSISSALAECCTSICLRLDWSSPGAQSRGPRREVEDAFNAFANARRVVLCFKKQSARWAGDEDSSGLMLQDQLVEALEAMSSRRITSLAILHLPCQAPSASSLSAHTSVLEELELSDDLYSAALQQGAVNVLAQSQDAIGRGDAMVMLALSMPNLRRLSLTSAAFSAQSVISLGLLTQLESLSIAGSMVCPGGAAQAATTHCALLAALPALRRLRLPMALASCDSAFAWGEDEDSPCGGECGVDGEGGWASGAVRNHSDGNNNGNGSNGAGGKSQGPPARGRVLFGTSVTPVSVAADVPVASPGRSSTGAGAASFRRAQCEASGGNTDGSASTSASGAHSQALQQRKHVQRGYGSLADFVFPAQLQDITIPLCAFNRPLFEAVCAAYAAPGSAEVPEPSQTGHAIWVGAAAGCGHERPSRPSPDGGAAGSLGQAPAAPGGDAAAPCPRAPSSNRSRLTTNTVTAPSSTFTSAGGLQAGAAAAAWSADDDAPAAGDACQTCGWSADTCDVAAAGAGPSQRNVGGDTDSSGARDGAGRLPIGGGGGGGGATRGTPACAGRLCSLHIPTLGGYSHWEGSFLTCARDFEKLGRLRGLEVLHLSLELSAFRLKDRNNMRGCFQQLRALTELKELRISEAQPPVCFTTRKRSCSARGAGAFGPQASAAAPSLDACTLQQLQCQWPRMRYLQFFGEAAVWSEVDGRLKVPDGLSCAGLVPPACACCREPHLLVAPPRRRGVWGQTPWAHA